MSTQEAFVAMVAAVALVWLWVFAHSLVDDVSNEWTEGE